MTINFNIFIPSVFLQTKSNFRHRHMPFKTKICFDKRSHWLTYSSFPKMLSTEGAGMYKFMGQTPT